MLEEGYYHSDPHPGNLLRTESGDLAYIVRCLPFQTRAAVQSMLLRLPAQLHLSLSVLVPAQQFRALNCRTLA